MFEAEGADGGEFGFGEDFADGVVGGVEDDHFGLGGYGGFEFGEVDRPVGGGGGAGCAVGGRVERNVFYDAASHFDVGEILVEEGFEDDDFVPGFDEAHERTEHAWATDGMLGSRRKDEMKVLAFRGDEEVALVLIEVRTEVEKHSPSLAPVVIVTSVSGSSVLPKNGE